MRNNDAAASETHAQRSSAFLALSALTVCAMACAVVVMAVPRPVPLSLPGLTFDGSALREQRARDDARSQRLVWNDQTKAVYAELLHAGLEELGVQRDPTAPRASDVFQHAVAQLHEEPLLSVRERATARFLQLLRAGPSAGAPPQGTAEQEARGLLGGQRALLTEYGYLEPGGELIAPPIVLSATYKVRFNMVFELPATYALTHVERLAYEGFRGLEAKLVPTPQREQALTAFAALGGAHGAEALAIVRALDGRPEALLARVRDPALATPLRVRNMALGLLRASQPGEAY